MSTLGRIGSILGAIADAIGLLCLLALAAITLIVAVSQVGLLPRS